MILKSFIDLAFILLCAAIVLLSQSVQLGSLDAAPAEVDAGQTQSVQPAEVIIVVVDANALRHNQATFPNANALHEALPPDAKLVLIPASEDLPHHRVMEVWSQLQTLTRDVQLGTRPTRATPQSP